MTPATRECPNGHQSQDLEWCDVCGAKLGSASASPPPPSALPSSPGAALGGSGPGTTVDCPHCGTPNEAAALFCEGCGYDFTTGQVAPVTEERVAVPAPTTTAAPTGWLVVVEVDPTWYDLRGELANQPCPRPTSSTVTLAGTAVLIGRTSRSLNVTPEIAIETDPGVSRRHAQLVFGVDETWTVVDLGSANGTYALTAGATPTADDPALPVGIPHRLADHDQIYLGAWSKLTLRNAGAASPSPSGTP
ncbi:MAG: FHA domain-containing protein [Ilumatobacteraceae bacterium]